MSKVITEPVKGWELECGTTEADSTVYVSVRKVATQLGQDLYKDKDPFLVSFLLDLAAKPQGDAGALDEEVAQERRRCAEMLRMSNASLMLMAGDMTPRELQTTQAVLGGLYRAMLREANRPKKTEVAEGDGSPHWLVRFR